MFDKIGIGLVAVLLWLSSPAAADKAAKSPSDGKATARKHLSSGASKVQLFMGKVVMLREALKKRKVTAFEEYKDLVALETPDGELIPIIPDWRGRAFFQDKRLRNRKVELIGYRRPGIPLLQVIVLFTFDKKGVRHYTDYWCDICSIPMYEIKPCDCCQGENRLRFQPRDLPADMLIPERSQGPVKNKGTAKETSTSKNGSQE